MEAPLDIGLLLCAFGMQQAQGELEAIARVGGWGMPSGGYAGGQMNQTVRLSTTPAEDILNKALDIRRRVEVKGGAV